MSSVPEVDFVCEKETVQLYFRSSRQKPSNQALGSNSRIVTVIPVNLYFENFGWYKFNTRDRKSVV